MKIDINEEYNRIHNVSDTYSPSNKDVAGPSFAKENSGAVFESGFSDNYIEKSSKSGKEALDKKEDLAAKQTQQQLAQLANSINEKEMANINEEIKSTEDEEIHTIVTVQEKIRMQLSAFCDDFDSGMVEDFSNAELEAISKIKGNATVWARKLKESGLPVTEANLEGIRFAFEMYGQLDGMTDGMKEYFITHPDKKITIDLMYLAKYSSMTNYNSNNVGNYYSVENSGYLTQNTRGGIFDEMLPDIMKMLGSEFIDKIGSVEKEAKWLFDRQLPVNEETIIKLKELEQSEYTNMSEDELLDKLIDALYLGKTPIYADLSDTSLSELFDKIKQVLNVLGASDEAIKSAVDEAGEDVSISDIAEAAKNQDLSQINISDDDISFITAKRQLEEIRLSMTIGAAAIMEKNGISVDTTAISQLVEHLKELENIFSSKMLASAGVDTNSQNVALYSEVTSAAEYIKNTHVQIVGTVAFEENITFEGLHNEAKVLADKYKDAVELYEKVMTKPRADMGDSIRTAFRNVDDILREMDLEVNKFNQRAVRILGYNSIEITYENIEMVKCADMELNYMLDNMTPSNVLKMIRDNYNPMNQSIGDIINKLSELNDDSYDNENKYSEFLWKLDQKKDITEAERESYIGIYRLVNQIEKSDGALVGALVAQGADVTMGNLLSALRTKNNKNIDYKVNDEFAGVDGRLTNDISKQINTYYRDLCANVVENISSDALSSSQTGDIMDMSLEQFVEYLDSFEEEMNYEYENKQLEDMRSLLNMSDKAAEVLDNYNIAESMDNLRAVSEMFSYSENWVKKLFDKSQKTEISNSEELARELLDNLVDKETMQEAYTSFIDETSSVIKESIINSSDNYIDVRTMKLLSLQMNIAGKMAGEESYQLPVEIGEEITTINLKFRYGTNETKKVGISMETKQFGCVSGSFTIVGKATEGYLAVAKEEGYSFMNSVKESFKQAIVTNTTLEAGNITIVKHSDISTEDLFSVKNNNETNAATANELYSVAKIFIEAIKSVDIM